MDAREPLSPCYSCLSQKAQNLDLESLLVEEFVPETPVVTRAMVREMNAQLGAEYDGECDEAA